MPVIDKGTHRCERCEKVFAWEYFEPIKNHLSRSEYQVENLPSPTLLARKQAGAFWKNCPYCDYDNKIKCCTDGMVI